MATQKPHPAPRGGPPPLQPLDLPILTYLRKKRVILASASPRRKALLSQVGLTNLEIVPSTVPEDISKADITPHEYVAATARQKCLDVYRTLLEAAEKAEVDGRTGFGGGGDGGSTSAKAEDEMDGGEEEKEDKEGDNEDGKAVLAKRDPDLVIAADTIISTRGGQILEKPRSVDDHRRMLKHLRDTRSHLVLTSVCCLAPRADATYPGYSLESHTEESTVYFARESDGLPDDVIEAYIKTREGRDKAGGYAVQGIGGLVLVERVEGSVDNVVGLPVRRCLQLAEKVIFRQGEEDEDSEYE